MLATNKVDRLDPPLIKTWKQVYPHKALGLFRLYDCFRKENKKGQVVLTKTYDDKATKDEWQQSEIKVF